mgnify:CR=1 FL=1
MHATPIIPGIAYRVKFQGRTVDVLAPHPCDAICIGLSLLERAKC